MKFFAFREFPYLLPTFERSLLIAYILWFFWGIFGVHKLYLGKPVMALVYFLTGGLLGIGWLLDAISLPWQVAWCNLRLLLAHRMEPQIVGGESIPAVRAPGGSVQGGIP